MTREKTTERKIVNVNGGDQNINDDKNNSINNNSNDDVDIVVSRLSDVGLDLLVIEEGTGSNHPQAGMTHYENHGGDGGVIAHEDEEDNIVILNDEDLAHPQQQQQQQPNRIHSANPSMTSLVSFSHRQRSSPSQQQQQVSHQGTQRSQSLRRNKSSTNFLRRLFSNTSSNMTVSGFAATGTGSAGGTRQRRSIDTRLIQSAIRRLGVDDDDDDNDNEDGSPSNSSSTGIDATAVSSTDKTTTSTSHHRCHTQNQQYTRRCYRQKVTQWYSDRIQRALEYTGTQSYGIVGIEVWEYQQPTKSSSLSSSNSSSHRLRMPAGGQWISPYLSIGPPAAATDEGIGDQQYKRRRDAIRAMTTNPQFVPPITQTVGVGLEGELWSRAKYRSVYNDENDDADDLSSISFRPPRDSGDSAAGDAGTTGTGTRDDLSISRRSSIRGSIVSFLDRSRSKRLSSTNNDPHHLPNTERETTDDIEQQQQQQTTGKRRLFGRQPTRSRAYPRQSNEQHHHNHQRHADIVAAALAEKIQPHYHHHGQTLVWRDMNQLFIDPDTPKCQRLEQQILAGFGQAAAIPFKEHGHEGIVIFMTRKSATKKSSSRVDYLNSMENQEFLFRQAKMIGSLISNAYAGRAVESAKQRLIRAAWHKFAHNLVEYKRSLVEEGKLEEQHPTASKDRKSSFHAFRSSVWNFAQTASPRRLSGTKATKQNHHLWTDMKSYLIKFKGGAGGGSHVIPPPLDVPQSGWTWIGVFCGLLILSAYNEKIMDASNGQYQLLIGPFGALMTLIYGLHSAPASQPRNVVLGQIVSGAISLSFTYIPETILPVWVRRALAPAFSIAGMVKLGVTHPPAGAHAVIYAGGKSGWLEYGLVVLGAMISVIPAVIINNMSARRQYPVYWGYVFDRIKQLRRRSKRKEKQ